VPSRDQRVVALDEVQDIPTADPEVSDYSELPRLAESAASFAMIQRGVLLSITRKVVVNDDVSAACHRSRPGGAPDVRARRLGAVDREFERAGWRGVVPLEP